MLDVLDLACVRGDKRLFSGLSFSVDAGSLLFVHGPNGAGKTTLLRTLCRLTLPEAGEIRWGAADIRSLHEEYLRHVAYLGHLNGLKDELSGLENLMVSTRLAGEQVTESDISAVLARLGVEACQDLPLKVLSQGQKKRMALARFLLNKTKLWILDEPFAALDVGAVDLLQRFIGEHALAGGMAVLTSHQEVEFTGVVVKHLHLNG
ncbi:MAG: heme exporter protein A [Halothiobacillaceae bacterium]|nr:MAG: heme exporter protein A [Halothiobacillaceae bacterium]